MLNQDKVISFRMSSDSYGKLASLAASLGLKPSQMVKQLVNQELKQGRSPYASFFKQLKQVSLDDKAAMDMVLGEIGEYRKVKHGD